MRLTVLIAASLLLSPVAAPAADQAPAAPANETAAPPEPTQKMICRSQVETGSLVKKTKRCFTKKQWKYVNEKSQEHIDRLQMDNATRQSGEGGTFGG